MIVICSLSVFHVVPRRCYAAPVLCVLSFNVQCFSPFDTCLFVRRNGVVGANNRRRED